MIKLTGMLDILWCIPIKRKDNKDVELYYDKS